MHQYYNYIYISLIKFFCLVFRTLDSFILCCYATKSNPNLNCESPSNQLSSCDDMLKTLALRFGIWMQGIIASLGNLAVIIWWTKYGKKTKKKTKAEKQDVQALLFCNLACADFLMGVYLLFIAVHDALWMGEYFQHDVEWRSGIGCKIAGALSTLSSEVSVMILVVVTADRIKSILFYFSPVRLTLRLTRIICSFIWITSSFLSVAPILVPSYFNDKVSGFSFYGRSTVCLPLQLSTDRPAGWEYSVGIFVVFNGASFLFILLGYLAIFIKVRQSARRVGSARSSKRPFGKRMLFIVLTDFCTWMPVITLSALSLTGHFNDSSGKVYAVIAVYVIPLNSSLNPVLYTFSTVETRKKLKKGFHNWCSKFSKFSKSGMLLRYWLESISYE